ncbi:hypothetical protein EIP91_001632 [Steccherinum ochraceum]|uniref:Uncharacterized protein n=1 Tax=Steccherinum ochraceum TaxID=92696 RepID=A0A4R0RM43_9APHY|nr:hypothetical protein EIP91_001632 [Steccherinum ochraceum]
MTKRKQNRVRLSDKLPNEVVPKAGQLAQSGVNDGLSDAVDSGSDQRPSSSPLVLHRRTKLKKNLAVHISSSPSTTSGLSPIQSSPSGNIPELPADPGNAFVLPENITVEELDMACALSYAQQNATSEGRFYAPVGILLNKYGRRFRDEIPDITQDDVVGKVFYWTQTHYQLPAIIRMHGLGDFKDILVSLAKNEVNDISSALDAISRKIPDVTCTRYKVKILEKVPAGVRVSIVSSQNIMNAEVKPRKTRRIYTTLRDGLEQAEEQAQFAFHEDETLQYLGVVVTHSTSWMFYEFFRSQIRNPGWLKVRGPKDVSNPHTEPDDTPEKNEQRPTQNPHRKYRPQSGEDSDFDDASYEYSDRDNDGSLPDTMLSLPRMSKRIKKIDETKAQEAEKAQAQDRGEAIPGPHRDPESKSPSGSPLAVPADTVDIQPPKFLRHLVPKPLLGEPYGVFQLGCHNEDLILDCIADHVKATLAKLASDASKRDRNAQAGPSNSNHSPEPNPRNLSSRPSKRRRSDSADSTAASPADSVAGAGEFVIPLPALQLPKNAPGPSRAANVAHKVPPREPESLGSSESEPTRATKSKRAPRHQAEPLGIPGPSHTSEPPRMSPRERRKRQRKRSRREERSSPDPIDFLSGDM